MGNINEDEYTYSLQGSKIGRIGVKYHGKSSFALIDISNVYSTYKERVKNNPIKNLKNQSCTMQTSIKCNEKEYINVYNTEFIREWNRYVEWLVRQIDIKNKSVITSKLNEDNTDYTSTGITLNNTVLYIYIYINRIRNGEVLPSMHLYKTTSIDIEKFKNIISNINEKHNPKSMYIDIFGFKEMKPYSLGKDGHVVNLLSNIIELYSRK